MAQRTLPPWFKVTFPGGPNYLRLKGLMREHGLHTICEEARCPNIGECWQAGTATFLILGDICTRSCAYCAVETGRPHGLDVTEPDQVASAVKSLGLKHAVVTSVNRDDLPDGGAEVFADVIQKIRAAAPGCTVEVLVPDFMGQPEPIRTVVEATPDVFNHNIEAVPRVFRRVRPKGSYQRSLEVLNQVKEWAPDLVTKSGLIVGMGESRDEVTETLHDLREAQVDVVTIGQYLRPGPSLRHFPVARFYSPGEFVEIERECLALGFSKVESGPLVRSSYHAQAHIPARS